MSASGAYVCMSTHYIYMYIYSKYIYIYIHVHPSFIGKRNAMAIMQMYVEAALAPYLCCHFTSVL